MRVAIAQVRSGPDPAANLALVREAVAAAGRAGARLLVLPEAVLRAFDAGPLAEVAQPLDGPWAGAVRRAVADVERAGSPLTVVVGTFTPAPGGRVANTLLVTGGGVEASYDKVHLFDAFGARESDTVSPGSDPVVVHVDGVGVGLATCYDVRFPGLFAALADAGAQVVALPASWATGPGKAEQWRLLVRARALDSTCAVLACDQAGPPAGSAEGAGHGAPTDHGSPTGVGGSLVVSALGEVLGELGRAPGTLLVDLDVAAVAQARRALPVLANRRF